MIDRAHDLPIAKQAEALNISRGSVYDLPLTRQAVVLKLSRSSVYYQPRPVSPADLAIMRRIDELHLEHPFMGARMLRRHLLRDGIEVGRRHVRTLMLRMGIEVAPEI